MDDQRRPARAPTRTRRHAGRDQLPPRAPQAHTVAGSGTFGPAGMCFGPARGRPAAGGCGREHRPRVPVYPGEVAAMRRRLILVTVIVATLLAVAGGIALVS